jgi:hypothetical protein
MKAFKIWKVENGVIFHIYGATEYLVNLLNNEKGYYSTYTYAKEAAKRQIKGIIK